MYKMMAVVKMDQKTEDDAAAPDENEMFEENAVLNVM